MNGTKRDFHFHFAEEEDMGIRSIVLSKQMHGSIYTHKHRCYIYLGHNVYGVELEKNTN